MIKRLNIKASTIVELLVTMIVSSIVLLSIMDGVHIAGKYLARQNNNVGANLDFYNDYCLLEGLLFNADSVRELNKSIVVYGGGEIMAYLSIVDSSMVVETDNMVDTLLRQVTSFSIRPTTQTKYIDTLLIDILTTSNEPLSLSFVVETSNRFQVEILAQKELKYEYK